MKFIYSDIDHLTYYYYNFIDPLLKAGVDFKKHMPNVECWINQMPIYKNNNTGRSSVNEHRPHYTFDDGKHYCVVPYTLDDVVPNVEPFLQTLFHEIGHYLHITRFGDDEKKWERWGREFGIKIDLEKIEERFGQGTYLYVPAHEKFANHFEKAIKYKTYSFNYYIKLIKEGDMS